jgi:hypothetical protein
VKYSHHQSALEQKVIESAKFMHQEFKVFGLKTSIAWSTVFGFAV